MMIASQNDGKDKARPTRVLVRLVVVLIAAVAIGLSVSPDAYAQRQMPDTEYQFQNAAPAYAKGAGPLIVISAYNSPLIERGSFDPLATLAETDGYRVEKSAAPLAEAIKANPAVLVIINAFSPDFEQYPAMDPPSAFSQEDIAAVKAWVEAGGSLLVLADHAPFGGGTSKLAEAFGFTYLNGHAAETKRADTGFAHVNIDFTPQNGLNVDHPITNGGEGMKPISHYFAFGGQAFIPSPEATTLLRIPDGWSAIMTYRIQQELKTALRIDASGMSQGAVADYGMGRLAIFGEAGGFTAQIIDGTNRFGFGSPEGKDNPEFVLSVLRWLTRYQPTK